MKKTDLKQKISMETETFTKILDNLRTSLAKGTVCVQAGDDFVSLKPSKNIDVTIAATQKKGKEKLSMELSWRHTSNSSESSAPLKISATEPEIKKESIPEETAAEKPKKPGVKSVAAV